MKLAFIDFYSENSSLHKDPVTIPKGLITIGHQVELVTRSNTLVTQIDGINVTFIDEWLRNISAHNKPDIVIAISRFDAELTGALKRVKDKNIPLVLKGDTDGTIGYPLIPNYLRTKPILKKPLNFLRHLKWRSRFSFAVKKKIEQMRLADLVICESPGALANLRQIFNYWKINQESVQFIPNPVSDYCTSSKLTQNKCSTIVCVGRWDDIECKGTDLLEKVIESTISNLGGFKFIIVGTFPDNLKKVINARFQDIVNFTGAVSFDETQKIVSNSKIILVPSRLESFSLASAEALCWGTTIVATPIESLKYLAGDGNFGSIAKGFDAISISNALASEINLWANGIRCPIKISTYWKAELNKEKVAKVWETQISKLMQITDTSDNK